MLDTNTISVATSGRSIAALHRIAGHIPEALAASAISYGEIWFGLTRRPEATALAHATRKLFEKVPVLPFTTASADRYAQLRTDMQRLGTSLQPLDMLIAAHALEAGATLVSSDRAFRHVPGLTVEDWTQ
ncbi:MAG: type II toxin-antitoxin system VapC family toxin [Rhizobiaceae bacterium]